MYERSWSRPAGLEIWSLWPRWTISSICWYVKRLSYNPHSFTLSNTLWVNTSTDRLSVVMDTVCHSLFSQYDINLAWPWVSIGIRIYTFLSLFVLARSLSLAVSILRDIENWTSLVISAHSQIQGTRLFTWYHHYANECSCTTIYSGKNEDH